MYFTFTLTSICLSEKADCADIRSIAPDAYDAGSKVGSTPIDRYAEFWPYYLREHSRPVTRGLHYIGTSLALACLVSFIASDLWILLVLALVSGYAFAWFGHFFVERNRPATFKYRLPAYP